MGNVDKPERECYLAIIDLPATSDCCIKLKDGREIPPELSKINERMVLLKRHDVRLYQYVTDSGLFVAEGWMNHIQQVKLRQHAAAELCKTSMATTARVSLPVTSEADINVNGSCWNITLEMSRLQGQRIELQYRADGGWFDAKDGWFWADDWLSDVERIDPIEQLRGKIALVKGRQAGTVAKVRLLGFDFSKGQFRTMMGYYDTIFEMVKQPKQ